MNCHFETCKQCKEGYIRHAIMCYCPKCSPRTLVAPPVTNNDSDHLKPEPLHELQSNHGAEAHKEIIHCTCASFHTVRGVHKSDCPASKCSCEGKYPNLQHHTPKSCWSKTGDLRQYAIDWLRATWKSEWDDGLQEAEASLNSYLDGNHKKYPPQRLYFNNEKHLTDEWVAPDSTDEWADQLEKIWGRAHIPDYANDAKIVIKSFIASLLKDQREKLEAENENDFDSWIKQWKEEGRTQERARILKVIEEEKLDDLPIDAASALVMVTHNAALTSLSSRTTKDI